MTHSRGVRHGKSILFLEVKCSCKVTFIKSVIPRNKSGKVTLVLLGSGCCTVVEYTVHN